jgi:tripartite ATP-independent transporter DctP family solute receptor
MATAAEAKVLKLSHTGAENHHYQEGALMFKDLVEERSNGDLVVEVYPLDQLGTQRESVEGAQLGTVDLVLTSDVQLSSFEPSFGALNLPYLFTNYAEVTKVLDGEVGEMLSDRLSEKGLVVLGYWENGFRDITNNVRPISKPEDLVGLKIRTPSGRVFVDSFNAWGANATPMPLTGSSTKFRTTTASPITFTSPSLWSSARSPGADSPTLTRRSSRMPPSKWPCG